MVSGRREGGGRVYARWSSNEPVDRSYFWMWALYDLRIGKSTDTVSSCQITSNDIIQLDANQLKVLKSWIAQGWGSTSMSETTD